MPSSVCVVMPLTVPVLQEMPSFETSTAPLFPTATAREPLLATP